MGIYFAQQGKIKLRQLFIIDIVIDFLRYFWLSCRRLDDGMSPCTWKSNGRYNECANDRLSFYACFRVPCPTYGVNYAP